MVKFTNNNNELMDVLKQLIYQKASKEPLIPRALFKELLQLQNETSLSIREMLWQAIRRYIDGERSNDKHIWINGIKYPIPERNRIP